MDHLPIQKERYSLLDQLFIHKDRLIAHRSFQRLVARIPVLREISKNRARGVFNLMAGFVYSQILLACVRVRLFEHLANGPLDITDLAKKIDLTSATDRLLSVAEKCLPANRNSSELLLALGILSYRKQLWGKARSYLESSINLKTSLDGLIYLSFVAEATQDNQLLSEAQHKLLTNIQSFK